MKMFWKVLIALGVVGALLGGVLWYKKANQAKTVFESVREHEKPTETDEPLVAPLEEMEPKVAVEEKKDEASGAENPADEVPNPDSKETVSDTKNESQDTEPKRFSIKSALVSFGHESTSGRTIDTIVLHSSHSVSGDPYDPGAVVALWKSYGVAPHYMIARDGTVSQLVADKNIAYHAGEGKMKDGRTGINNFSIGVEILNTKDDEYTSAQYQAVKDLIAYLKGKYSIKSVVGHDDIAPGRKTDPWNFDWNKI